MLGDITEDSLATSPGIRTRGRGGGCKSASADVDVPDAADGLRGLIGENIITRLGRSRTCHPAFLWE
jgi:hypothetical protein